jgi:hypothetical protein
MLFWLMGVFGHGIMKLYAAQTQVLALLASKVGTAQAGTHNTLIQLYAVFGGSWAFAMTDAVAIRIGYHLGNGRADEATAGLPKFWTHRKNI